MHKMGAYNFFPVPLCTVPTVVLRSVEQMIISRMQPALNIEYVPRMNSTRILARGTHRGRRVLRQRTHNTTAPRRCSPKVLSVVTLLPGGLVFPDLTSVLQYAFSHKLKCFDVVIHAGDVVVTHNRDLVGIFGRSAVAWTNDEAHLAPVALADVLHEVASPCNADRKLRIIQLRAVGWRLWASNTLLEAIRAPYTIKLWYKLNQKSFVRLWIVAQTWPRWKERCTLKQLCAKVCKRVHHVDLTWVPVLRVPYGLQQTHPICRNFLQLTIRECTWASKCIQNLWLQNARVVHMQGRSVGSVLGTYRHVCKSVALDLNAEQSANTLVETPQIPGYSGRACFRGDDSSLPVWLRHVTSLHCGYIPAQSLLHSSVMRKLAGQFTTIRHLFRLRAGQDAVWEAWLRSQVTHLQPVFPSYCGSITLTELLNVKKLLRHLVGVPIDKNNILWFEPESMLEG
jgi:hypothetical protein